MSEAESTVRAHNIAADGHTVARKHHGGISERDELYCRCVRINVRRSVLWVCAYQYQMKYFVGVGVSKPKGGMSDQRIQWYCVTEHELTSALSAFSRIRASREEDLVHATARGGWQP